jgi:hypothetical protein
MSRASTLSGFTTAIGQPTDLNVGVVTATRIDAENITASNTYEFTNLSITGIATVGDSISIGSTLVGVTTINSSGINSPLGVSTLSNVVIGGATTEMVVTGDTRITGILTVGTGSVTINGITNRVGINSTSPAVALDTRNTTDGFALPVGTTAQRPSTPYNGYMRWNSSNTALEVYDGTNWVEIITDYFPSGSTILG